MNRKLRFSPIHLKSGLTCNDKRYQEFPYFLRRKGNHTLWWIVSNPQVLSKAETKATSAKLCSLSSTAYQIPHLRANFVHLVLYYCWNIAHRQYSPLTIQRCIQETFRSKNLPQSYYNKTLSTQTFTKGYSPNCQSAQFATTEIVFYPFYSNQCNIRYRPNSNYRLWQARAHQNWLQSPQTGKTLLLPVSLFRIQPPGILAGKPALGEYRSSKISQTYPKRMYSQITETRKKNSYPSRLTLLRPQIHRILRREKNWLHHRSNNNQANTRDNSSTKISSLQKRLGNSRIYLSATWLENSPSFCCSAKASARKPRRSVSTESLCNKRIRLQNYCNQSQIKTQTHLEFPQSKSKELRIKYQRAKEQLSINKNSNPELHSKYCLSSTAFVCLQYCQLVQAAMSTQGIPLQNITNYSPRFINNTSQISQIWRQKYTKVPYWLPISKFALSNYGKDQEYGNLKILSKVKRYVPSES